MAYNDYSEMLLEARNKARVSGRQLSQRDIAGMTAGYADQASERNTRAKSLLMQQDALDFQKAEGLRREKQQKKRFDYQVKDDRYMRKAAKRAERREAIGSILTTGAAVYAANYDKGDFTTFWDSIWD